MKMSRSHRRPRRAQAGLTLIELMVSVTIGMLMIAAIAILMADQSATRAEADKAGRMIENGRFAVYAIASDLQMAGYWGERSTPPGDPAALPDPCSTVVADVIDAMGMHVQGFNAPGSGAAPSCVANHKPGTDILVVRRVNPDMSTLMTASVPDVTKLTSGRLYLQTGVTPGAASTFGQVLASASADSATNSATFSLLRRDMTTRANIRMVLTHIYYVSTCSVVSGGACQDTIPTLKRVELGQGTTTTTLAEGIDDLQFDYGVDTDGNGAPDTYVNGAALTVADWPDVMTVKIHVLTRSSETVPGYTDQKSYAMGTAPAVAAPGDAYKRHVLVQTVRLVNPSGWRRS